MLEVDRDAVVEEFRRDLVDRVALVVRRIVDQDGDRPERLAHLLDRAPERRDVGDVAMLVVQRPLPAEVGLKLLRRRVGDVEKSDPGALRGEATHDRLADAHRAAGDQHDAVLQAGVDRIVGHGFLKARCSSFELLSA